MTADGTAAPWTITADDHDWFTAFSGDANPLHADPVAARRLLGGRMLVHGAHLLLRALEDVAAAGAITTVPSSISVVFRDGVGIGDPLVTTVTSAADSGRLDVSIERAEPPGATVATIRVERAAPAEPTSDLIDVFEPVTRPPERPSEPRPLDLDGLAAMVGAEQPSLHPAVDPVACRAALPSITAVLGAGRVAEVAAISCVIGMLTPGRSSMSSAYDITFHEPTGPDAVIDHRVDQVDARLRRVRLTVHGTSLRAAVTAFSPPPPVDQAVALAGATPTSGEFDGWRVLVVGGSRGLGEATVRLLTAGGADVRFTWCTGADEADRLAADVGCVGRRWCAPADHANAALTALWLPTHVCWFASPSSDRDPAATAIEVEAFERTVATLPAPPLLGVLWPSTDLLDRPDDPPPPGSAGWLQRKLAGEAACDRLAASRPAVVVRAARLPILLTDRTQTLLPREYVDTAATLLAVLRTLPSPAVETPGGAD